MKYEGECHCAKVKVAFKTQRTPDELGVRTCQCAFCRRHGAINISDPAGLTTIACAPDDIVRYRFHLRTADFLFCRHCGVYFAAVMGKGEKTCSTINVAGLKMDAFSGVDEKPMEYGGETLEERVARRYDRWTPTRFTDARLNADDFGPH